jgi:outer membrane immunogenic protein
MKKFTLTLALSCACTALIYAGPEPMASKEIAPVPAPAPSCFEGWYAGVHGGGIWANLDTTTSAFEETLAPAGRGGFSESLFLAVRQTDQTSWEGGLHGGYNWQRGGWVFGLEVDIQGTDLQRNAEVFDFIQLPGGNSEEHVYTTSIVSHAALDWYATGRVRVGHTLGDRVMIFGTGGGAVGLTELNEVTSVNENTRFGGAFSDTFRAGNREVRGGWTGGGGIDICLSQHWILNFTYLYVDLGDEHVGNSVVFTSLPVSFGVRTFDSETRARADFKFHDFRGGLTFHF